MLLEIRYPTVIQGLHAFITYSLLTAMKVFGNFRIDLLTLSFLLIIFFSLNEMLGAFFWKLQSKHTIILAFT